MTMLDGKISISMPSGHDCDYVTIEIEDDKSHAQFVKIQVKYADFTKALMKMHGTPMKFEARGLEVVGKVREQKELVFLVGAEIWGKHKEYAEENCQQYTDEGWTASNYFRSQSSIQKHEDGNFYAHGMQFRYIKDSE